MYVFHPIYRIYCFTFLPFNNESTDKQLIRDYRLMLSNLNEAAVNPFNFCFRFIKISIYI